MSFAKKNSRHVTLHVNIIQENGGLYRQNLDKSCLAAWFGWFKMVVMLFIMPNHVFYVKSLETFYILGRQRKRNCLNLPHGIPCVLRQWRLHSGYFRKNENNNTRSAISLLYPFDLLTFFQCTGARRQNDVSIGYHTFVLTADPSVLGDE